MGYVNGDMMVMVVNIFQVHQLLRRVIVSKVASLLHRDVNHMMETIVAVVAGTEKELVKDALQRPRGWGTFLTRSVRSRGR